MATREDLRNRYEMAKEKLTMLKNAGKPYGPQAKKVEELLVKYMAAKDGRARMHDALDAVLDRKARAGDVGPFRKGQRVYSPEHPRSEGTVDEVYADGSLKISWHEPPNPGMKFGQRSVELWSPSDLGALTAVPGAAYKKAAKGGSELHKAKAGDELWTPNHSNPVPSGWRKLSKEAMELAGKAQSAMGKLDKNWEPNRPLFAALRRINEAQRAGDEAKLRAAFADLKSKLAAADTGVALDGKVGDTDFKPGDRVWANPIGGSGGTVKGTVARINASGQVVIESGGREREFHPSNVRASDAVLKARLRDAVRAATR